MPPERSRLRRRSWPGACLLRLFGWGWCDQLIIDGVVHQMLEEVVRIPVDRGRRVGMGSAVVERLLGWGRILRYAQLLRRGATQDAVNGCCSFDAGLLRKRKWLPGLAGLRVTQLGCRMQLTTLSTSRGCSGNGDGLAATSRSRASVPLVRRYVRFVF